MIIQTQQIIYLLCNTCNNQMHHSNIEKIVSVFHASREKFKETEKKIQLIRIAIFRIQDADRKLMRHTLREISALDYAYDTSKFKINDFACIIIVIF